MNVMQVLRARGVMVGKKITGDALPANVLNGKTYMNASGEQTGTMPERGAVTLTPGAAEVAIPDGHHSGTGKVTAVANLTAARIKFGETVGGVVGTFSSGLTAAATDILAGKTAAVDGNVITGTKTNRGAVTITPGATDQAIPEGAHSGLGKVLAVPVDSSKVLAGTTIAGTPGTMPNRGAGSSITPGTSNQVLPEGFYSSPITVVGDADKVPGNIRQGVTIDGVTGTVIPGVPNAQGTSTTSAGGILSVRGLPFQPTLFVCRGTGGNSAGTSAVYSDGTHVTAYAERYYSSSTPQIAATTLYADGIDINVGSPSSGYTWIAIA